MNKLPIEKSELIESIIKAMVLNPKGAFATSTQIAKYFGIPHNDLLKKIRSFHSFQSLKGLGKISQRNRNIKGRNYPYFQLDADAFSFICLSINGKKAEAFKWLFIDAFKKANLEVITSQVRADTNRANTIWIEEREQSKEIHKGYADVVKEFCIYAEAQRGRAYNIDNSGNPNNKPCPYFIHLQRVVYQKANLSIKKGVSPKRDALLGSELQRVEAVEIQVSDTMINLMANNVHYKKIFKEIKSMVLNEEELSQ